MESRAPESGVSEARIRAGLVRALQPLEDAVRSGEAWQSVQRGLFLVGAGFTFVCVPLFWFVDLDSELTPFLMLAVLAESVILKGRARWRVFEDWEGFIRIHPKWLTVCRHGLSVIWALTFVFLLVLLPIGAEHQWSWIGKGFRPILIGFATTIQVTFLAFAVFGSKAVPTFRLGPRLRPDSWFRRRGGNGARARSSPAK